VFLSRTMENEISFRRQQAGTLNMGKSPNIIDKYSPVYVITIFENFSRMALSSAISASQTQWDYLAVLADAIRRYGAPEAIVTDGGGQFYSTVALQLYDMLGIRKEHIDPGELWHIYS